MLEEGNSRLEAETEIGVLLSILDVFKHGSARLVTEDGRLKLQASLSTVK